MDLNMSNSPIPDLNDVVIRALDLHAGAPIPRMKLAPARRRLIVASGNALPTARVLFADEPAVFADEGRYAGVLASDSGIDSGIVISASGEKHAPGIVERLLDRGLSTYLVTCKPESTAARRLPSERVIATPSVPEPLTYNTSTYIGMMLVKTREDTRSIKRFLKKKVQPRIPDFKKFGAFYLMVPPRFDGVREMFVTKFDELFGGRLTGRCYTTEQTMHAKTVVPWDRELFITFGSRNRDYGSHRLDIPLPEDAGFVAMVAVGYYVIGHIQARKPAWFKQHVEEYKKIQERLFARQKQAAKP